MNIQFISDEAYKDLTDRLDRIEEAVGKPTKKVTFDDPWVENATAAIDLGVSKRWLQDLRTQGLIEFSKVKGRIYYRASELTRLMEENIVKSKNSKK